MVALGLVVLVGAGYGLRRATLPSAGRRAASMSHTTQPGSAGELSSPLGSEDVVASAPDLDEWRDQLLAIRSQLDAGRFVDDLRRLPTGESAYIARSLLSASETSASHGELLLDFLAGDALHPRLFEILVEIARTASGPPRYRALRALGDLTFLDLAEDPSLLDRLVQDTEGAAPEQAIRHAAGRFVDRLREAPPEARGEILMKGFALATRPRALAAAGVSGVFRDRQLPELVMAYIKTGDAGLEEANVAHAWIRAALPSRDFVCQHYLPVIEQAASASIDDVRAAAVVLGHPENEWAVAPLIAAYASMRSQQKQLVISDALDRILQEPWLPWFHRARESLGAELRRLELPSRHPWEAER